MEQFKASDEEWEAVEGLAKSFGDKICCTILELRDSVAALEAALDRVLVRNQTGEYLRAGTLVYPAVQDATYDSAYDEQGLKAGRAEQQATTEPATDPEPGDFQTLHGIALDMVDSLRPIVIPEILNVLRRAIREPMAQQQAAAEATPEPEPEPVHSQYFSGHGLIAGEIDRALAEGGWTPTPEPTPEPETSPSPAADGGLVEEAVRAMRAAPLGYQPKARTTILEAAGWLHREGHLSAAALLEREANR